MLRCYVLSQRIWSIWQWLKGRDDRAAPSPSSTKGWWKTGNLPVGSGRRMLTVCIMIVEDDGLPALIYPIECGPCCMTDQEMNNSKRAKSSTREQGVKFSCGGHETTNTIEEVNMHDMQWQKPKNQFSNCYKPHILHP